MPRNVLCCLVLWFPFLVFTPSEVVCCANCTPSNPISLLLRADNTVHNVETILLRGVDIYCSTIEYKIPLCKVSLPYIPYTPHPNSIAERCTKFEESHFWPFLSFLLSLREKWVCLPPILIFLLLHHFNCCSRWWEETTTRRLECLVNKEKHLLCNLLSFLRQNWLLMLKHLLALVWWAMFMCNVSFLVIPLWLQIFDHKENICGALELVE